MIDETIRKSISSRMRKDPLMHKKAEQEFDSQTASLFDRIFLALLFIGSATLVVMCIAAVVRRIHGLHG